MPTNRHTIQEIRAFEMAADYLRTNGFTTPFLSVGIAFALWQWLPGWPVVAWAVIVIVSQIAMGIVTHLALKDPNKERNYPIWRWRVTMTSVVSCAFFASAMFVFYVPGERLNNLLLIAMAVASIATLAGMTAPDSRLMRYMCAPPAAALIATCLVHEPYPFGLIFAGLATFFLVETYITSTKLAKMVSNMLDLQVGNAQLIENLAAEKRESDAARILAENASHAKSNFLANMSHELRTPLNAILGFSEVIRDRIFGEAAQERYSSYANDIHNSGKHLLNLINDILDLSRIEAGANALTETDFALTDLFDDALRLVSPQAAAKDILLKSAPAQDLGLLADRRAIKQVLVNLLANAVKFTPNGGAIAMNGVLDEHGGVVVTVSDNGVGIAREDLDRVMQKFGQARHDVAAESAKGVGLGLPIAKGLVEAHQGALTLTSEPGRGTEVRLTFPPARTIPRRIAA